MTETHHRSRVDHPAAAAAFTANRERMRWHDESLWLVRTKRDRAAAAVEGWETLRTLASGIKEHTLTHLDTYLVQFEQAAARNGVQVHWAADGAEHNRIVHEILASRGVRRLVKSKSMLTEECGLNPYLEARGLEIVDTDLGERIVQLLDERPSHIVLPAIHLKKEEIGALFHRKLGTEEGATDPTYLTGAARTHLREKFLSAQAAITGANFAVAETGGFVVVTNEGNADLGAHIAPLHIACIGIEKLIPKAEHLGVFLRLLARSATGQPLSVYTSHFHRPRSGQELHVVLVDNGRSAHLGRAEFWRSLKCIRCGACMNTCPIYRRSGGHSYGSVIPGPIGAILTPGLDLHRYATLPFASTLCGSCSDVCPVRIDIHGQLYAWRQVVGRAGEGGRGKRMLMGMAGRVFGHPSWYAMIGRWARRAIRRFPGLTTRNRFNAWGTRRDMPEPPRESFSDWYVRTRGGG